MFLIEVVSEGVFVESVHPAEMSIRDRQMIMEIICECFMRILLPQRY
jgi:hypothetical protein